MKYINEFKESDNIIGIYLCKQKNLAQTKNGKDYENVTLCDKTGSISCKIWEPNSMGIGDFGVNDYVEIRGKVFMFNGTLQMSIDRAFKAPEGTYNPADYLPVSPNDIDDMFAALLKIIDTVSAPYFRLLLESFFVNNPDFIGVFKTHSAAKAIHHGFVGGLLHHTLSVAKLCSFYCTQYPSLNRDLLITAAICHDIGKVRELCGFPENDYTDEGQLIGHIVIGVEMIDEKLKEIKDFPTKRATELKHCILAHHGEFEFGSPKKPALIEAVALNFADNTDAKIHSMIETFEASRQLPGECKWLGYNRIFDSNIRPTD
ncbi:MAG: 3'-5' exoribonuclease YhaM family protein [Lachnospiraceae bacterium]|jgi:3'-5' exoribonuclease